MNSKAVSNKDKNETDINCKVMKNTETMRMNRRTFVKVTGAAVGALALGRFGLIRTADGAIIPQTPMAGSAIPQFMDPLPMLRVIAGRNAIELRMTEFTSNVLPNFLLPNGTTYAGTRVWGYLEPGQAAIPSYIGPVIVASRGTPIEMKYVNNLGDAAGTAVVAWKNSTDQTLHWADPLNGEGNACSHMGGIPSPGTACAQNYAGPVPAVPHLHGGEVPPVLDGGPDAWFTSDGNHLGHGYYTRGYKGEVTSLPLLPDILYPAGTIVFDQATKKFYVVDATGLIWNPYTGNQTVYRYPNTQEASPIWFHDHALGITRLNVYSGLAGAYLITDPVNKPPPDLDDPTKIVPLVLQDRMFDVNGQLFFPADSIGGVLWTPNPDHPYWVPEFVGDTIVVNGKAWPYLNVEAKRYRFLFLNGSNARTYEMFLINQTAGGTPGPVFYQIGTDGGYLDAPVKIDPNDPVMPMKLTLMPGERADVIIDFSGLPVGTSLLMRNTGRTPYPKGKSPQGSTTGRIIEVRVVDPVNPLTPVTVQALTYNPVGGAALRTPMVRLTTGGVPPATPANTRQLTLNEVLKPPSTAIDPVTGVLTAYPGGPLEILVNNTKWDGFSDMTLFPPSGIRPDFKPIATGGMTTYYSELPREGDTEVWDIVNTTADAHPMHLHLVQFQLINRQSYNTNNYAAAYDAAFPGGLRIPGFGPPADYTTGKKYDPVTKTFNGLKITNLIGGNPDVTPFLQGAVQLPAPNEAGWKDTVMVPPGMVTRIAVRWAPTDVPAGTAGNFPFNPDGGHGFVWHCHIIDHEDNEMMRPTSVQAVVANRIYKQGIDY